MIEKILRLCIERYDTSRPDENRLTKTTTKASRRLNLTRLFQAIMILMRSNYTKIHLSKKSTYNRLGMTVCKSRREAVTTGD